ncbi:MAG: saccharopine dehydrogenase [Acidobacteria bacterium]|nr:MAG: saccharopine dehydrogenase [Acidobacteriota bacterium]
MASAQGGVAGREAAVLGAGRQGTAAAFDLLRFGGAARVRLIDADPVRLSDAALRLQHLGLGDSLETAAVDATDERALAKALEGAVTAVCALPYRLGPAAARAALAAGCSLADLGGNTEISRRILELDRPARERGVCLVPDTGLAPGLANTLAADGLRRLPAARSVRIWCGGLPQTPIPPLGYRQVFSIEGLLNEYSGDAVYLRGGEIVRVPALSEREELELPGVGRVEAFPTSGGTSTAPETFRGRLDTYEYRTVRYPGHLERFKTLADLGLLGEEKIPAGDGHVRPRDLLIRLLAPLIDRPDVPDLVVLRVEVEAPEDAAPRRVIYDLLDREDRETGFTAMERCTAHPAAVVAEMAAAGEIDPGAQRLETGVPPEPFLERLARRPLALTVREE